MAMIEEKEILHNTHYGLGVYAHILRRYYPDEVVIELSGKNCKVTRNPFNGNKTTLNICNHDWVFYYEDAELPDFKGNPFDFAALHYHLNGQELLNMINSDMNLQIGQPKGFYTNKKCTMVVNEITANLPKFSYFRCPVTNTHPSAEMTLLDVYEAVKGSSYKQETEELRRINEPEIARKFKARNFDYVTFSGLFSKRSDSALIRHSGLITLDFDHVSNISELRETLLHDRYFETELMFTSPSGDGLKWIVSIDLKECNHQGWFLAINAYLEATYRLKVDQSGKDISRACFLPYCPTIYINPTYLQYTFPKTTDNTTNYERKI